MRGSDDPGLGTRLAGYRLEAVLGRGRTGVVFLAEDLRLGRRVALRLLADDLAGDEAFRERFLRESQLAVSLEHPGIVPVFEAGEAEGRLFVVTASVEGAELASLLALGGRLEPERALSVVVELAGALDAARWSRGLVHGSLTSRAVLVVAAAEADGRERVALLGFGQRIELPPGTSLAEAARRRDRLPRPGADRGESGQPSN